MNFKVDGGSNVGSPHTPNYTGIIREDIFPEGGGVGEVAMFEHRMDLLGYS